MDSNRFRSYLPRSLGGFDRKEILGEENFLSSPGSRPDVIRERLMENLPENGSVKGQIEFMDMDDEELGTKEYSGFNELEAAYETWLAGYDSDTEILTAELYQGNNGGEFEIRLEEIDNLRTSEWTGPYRPARSHNRESYDELAGRESVKRMRTGDTVAVLKGEYRREL